MAKVKIKYLLVLSNLLFAYPAMADYDADYARAEMVNQANADSQRMQMEQAAAIQQQQMADQQRQIEAQQRQIEATQNRARGYGW